MLLSTAVIIFCYIFFLLEKLTFHYLLIIVYLNLYNIYFQLMLIILWRRKPTNLDIITTCESIDFSFLKDDSKTQWNRFFVSITNINYSIEITVIPIKTVLFSLIHVKLNLHNQISKWVFKKIFFDAKK